MGKTIEAGNARIHRYAELFEMIELDNAGKRGRTCKRMIIALTTAGARRQGWSAELWTERMAMAIEDAARRNGTRGVRALISDLLVDFPGEIRMDDEEIPSYGVMKAGTKVYEFKTSSGITVKADPHHFVIKCSWALGEGRSHDEMIYERNKTAARKFYTWFSKNESGLDELTFPQAKLKLSELGVKFDGY